MHLKALKIFCDVAYRRSFSRRRTTTEFRSPAPVRSSINWSVVEREAGRSLEAPFTLTPEGEVFYEGCRKLLERYDVLEEEVRTLHEEVAGRVRVASIYSVGLHHMNRYLQDFLSQYPRPMCGSSICIRTASMRPSKTIRPTSAW